MISNLNRLKKQLQKGTEFVITDHCLLNISDSAGR